MYLTRSGTIVHIDAAFGISEDAAEPLGLKARVRQLCRCRRYSSCTRPQGRWSCRGGSRSRRQGR